MTTEPSNRVKGIYSERQVHSAARCFLPREAGGLLCTEEDGDDLYILTQGGGYRVPLVRIRAECERMEEEECRHNRERWPLTPQSEARADSDLIA